MNEIMRSIGQGRHVMNTTPWVISTWPRVGVKYVCQSCSFHEAVHRSLMYESQKPFYAENSCGHSFNTSVISRPRYKSNEMSRYYANKLLGHHDGGQGYSLYLLRHTHDVCAELIFIILHIYITFSYLLS